MKTYPFISDAPLPVFLYPTEAVDILKEMKEKNVVLTDTHITSFFHMLNAVSAKDDVATVRRLQETIFSLGLAKPSTNLCSPLVTAYLSR